MQSKDGLDDYHDEFEEDNWFKNFNFKTT
jgi:hypothetical protein